MRVRALDAKDKGEKTSSKDGKVLGCHQSTIFGIKKLCQETHPAQSLLA